jgi:hypothetical protein
MSHRAASGALVACLVAAALAACGLPARNIEASWSKSYSTLRGLDRDSSMVAMVMITGPGHPRADEVEGAGIDTTAHYAADVVRAIHGKASGTLQLMLDTSDQMGAEFPAPLETGHEYVLFLTPFEWLRGGPTGDWIVTGETGIYRVGDDGLDLVPGGAGEGLPTHFTNVDALAADL